MQIVPRRSVAQMSSTKEALPSERALRFCQTAFVEVRNSESC